ACECRKSACWHATVFVVIFFFQAEDGIRDWSVTGVQTCALPISLERFQRGRPADRRGELPVDLRPRLGRAAGRELVEDFLETLEIGRASCRERVEISGVGVSLKEKG